MSKPTILITGSGGFVFSNFIRRCIYKKLDYRFVSIDRIKKNQTLNNVYTNKNHTFYIGDIADNHFINIIFEIERPSIVIHGAAESHVDDSIANAQPFINTNILGTQVIIDACLKWNVDKLIYTSTDECYGQLNSETDASWTEESPINPRNAYAASKMAGELLIRAAHETHGLQYNITRSCNNYGPRQTSDKFIPKTIKSLLNNKPMPIYGQGKQIRDWMHVVDNCDGIIKILQNGKPNETYNISANQEFSNIEIFQEICNNLGRGWELASFVPDRLGHDYRYSISSNKLRQLGWEPQHKFKKSIGEVITWYQNNNFFIRD